MSFNRDARTVRDESAPLAYRVRALRQCVSRYAPYGYAATLEYLRERYGPLDEPSSLVPAVAALETSRRVWLADVAEFGGRRREAKAQGCRRAATSEVARLRQLRWPGGEAAGGPVTGSDADRPVAYQFLVSFGTCGWEPAPVNQRRRARRAGDISWPYWPAVATLGFGLVILPIIGLVTRLVFDPPAIFFWSFASVAVVALPVAAASQVASGAARQRAIRTRNQRVRQAAQAAERRWQIERLHSFTLTADGPRSP